MTTKAQSFTIDVLHQGNSFSDSSYYDIIKVEDKYWIAGKYGILKSIDSEGNLENIDYPSLDLDIYKLENLDNNKIIASGDKGTIYIHDLISKTWQTIQVKGYENACFYNLAVDNEHNIYVGGGNSKIAHSKKTIPYGFILTSKDGGKTWNNSFKNMLNMVWCVKRNEFNNKMYALMYTINKTFLYELKDEKWKKKQKIGNSIFHEVQFEDEKNFVATGGWIGKKGRINSNTQKNVIENSGLLWGRVKNEHFTLYTGCDGKILVEFENGDKQLSETKLNLPFSIYEAIFVDTYTAYAIGSGRTLLKIQFGDTHNLETKEF
jgi:hypothetical protein